ncbi:MAG: type II toxin-antitoxin system VapC family toxin [Candidatus Hydrogenedentes bacterium]|nr:type II toxin-antitoxin system VapC family toxin [Candidatus Hydrogenedentota bacterium]
MNLLLDTHALLWWLDDDPRLTARERKAIADPYGVVFVSAATAWEIAVKIALGKLDAPDRLAEILVENGFRELPIDFDHALRAGALPPIHRDPFDRMLTAQAQIEDLTIVTHDTNIPRYEVAVLNS